MCHIHVVIQIDVSKISDILPILKGMHTGYVAKDTSHHLQEGMLNSKAVGLNNVMWEDFDMSGFGETCTKLKKILISSLFAQLSAQLIC